MTTRRRIAIATIAAASLCIGTQRQAAADDRHESESKFEFKSLNANAVLTDCPLGGPAGLHCTGIVVAAGRNKDTFQTSTFVSVQLYDVELTQDGFTPTLIGSGSTDAAKVSIHDDLKRASMSGIVDITNCTTDPNAPEPTCTFVRTLNIRVRWIGVGDITRTHFEDSFEANGCAFEFDNDIKNRSATVTATLDGVGIPNSSRPEFAPSLNSSEGEQKVECELPHLGNRGGYVE
jgi:hypothetical protein